MENSLGLRPPPTLCLDSTNLAKSWKTWKEEFTLYMDLTLADASEDVKLKVFSYLIGETERELCETLISSSSPDWTVDRLISALDGHCGPKVNETVERYRLGRAFWDGTQMVQVILRRERLLCEYRRAYV